MNQQYSSCCRAIHRGVYTTTFNMSQGGERLNDQYWTGNRGMRLCGGCSPANVHRQMMMRLQVPSCKHANAGSTRLATRMLAGPGTLLAARIKRSRRHLVAAYTLTTTITVIADSLYRKQRR